MLDRLGGNAQVLTDPREVVGSVPLAELNGLALLSNGTARLVTSYDVMSWSELTACAADEGPETLLHHLRAAETEIGDGAAPDDASIAWWQMPR